MWVYRVIGKKDGKEEQEVLVDNLDSWYDAVVATHKYIGDESVKDIAIQWSEVLDNVNIWNASDKIQSMGKGYVNQDETGEVEVIYWSEDIGAFVNIWGEVREPKSWEGKGRSEDGRVLLPSCRQKSG